MDLELDRTRKDCGPELVIHGICRLEDLERFDSKAELGVLGDSYRTEDFVDFVVAVEPTPDGVQEVELASRHGVTDRDITQLVLDYKIRSTLAFRPSDCSLARESF